ncbi:hypothetical protein [Brevibacillus brevis]|uniref:Uncharacterized protein n=1 Tax=Brevibacillus brevis TaxID=1393 RepID=A0ABY9TCS6_BREBE|nr:hypothetical protein [Brevibacillus brevis]WNC17920.1 hypothetical protein RGB73_30155 [Brevibacillus brevis]
MKINSFLERHEYLRFALVYISMVIRLALVGIFVWSLFYYSEINNFRVLTGIENELIHWTALAIYGLGGSYVLVPQLFKRVKK